MAAADDNTRPSCLAFEGRQVERVPTPDEGAHVKDTPLSRDAEEFGIYARSGGWRLGLLVARNVERGAGEGGDPAGRHRNGRNGGEKVSARAFAAEAGTSAPRVLRYLDAWDRAAEAGHVPPAEDLKPGIEFDLPEQETVRWSEFYDAGRSSNQASVKRSLPAIGRAADDDPEFAAKAAEKVTAAMAPQDRARLAADLLSDDDTAAALGKDVQSEAAVRAAARAVSGERTTQRPPAKDLGHQIDAVADLAHARRLFGRALGHIQDLSPEQRSKIRNMVEAELVRIETVTGWFHSLLHEQAHDWDDALADLIAEGEGR